jgi:hypothetical protein
MSETLPGRDLKTLLTQMENDWQELKDLLRSEQRESRASPLLDRQDLDRQGNLGGITGIIEETPAPHLPEGLAETKRLNSRGTITAVEAEAIVQGVEKVHGDAQILERLVRVEKQNRRIVILGSMFLTILALTLGVVAFLMVQSHLLGKVGLLSAAPGIIQPESTVFDSPEKIVSAKQPEKDLPVVYVGSKTSNKYHYPDCKWAKMIPPERLITFKSVEEAQEAGYKRCPVCKPPISE